MVMFESSIDARSASIDGGYCTCRQIFNGENFDTDNDIGYEERNKLKLG